MLRHECNSLCINGHDLELARSSLARLSSAESMQSIALVVWYFGKLPEYFPLWLHSAGCNQTIVFILLSDCNLSNYIIPRNVIAIPFEMHELRALASEKLGIRIKLERPYKCCDYRTAYGLIFEDLLEGFDWWGYCDVDLAFGNIRSFVTEEKLKSIDVYGRLGHFAIIRNTDNLKKIFQLPGSMRSWEEVYSQETSFAFDEVTGIQAIVQFNEILHLYEETLIDIDKRIRSSIRARNKRNDWKLQLVLWSSGRVYLITESSDRIIAEENMYAHFQKKSMPILFNAIGRDDILIFTTNGVKKQLVCCLPTKERDR